MVFVFKQKTAYEMRISDWSSDVCSSDLAGALSPRAAAPPLLWERLQPRAFSRTIAASMPREGTARIASPRLSRELAGWRRKLAAEAAPARSNLSFPILEQAALAVAFRSHERRVGKEGVRPGKTRW